MVVRAPRKRGRIPTFDRSRADLCSVRLPKAGNEVVAAAPITARGRTFLDELGIASLMSVVLDIGDHDGTPAPAADVVAQGNRAIVALDRPDASPPRGKVGYWTDGCASWWRRSAPRAGACSSRSSATSSGPTCSATSHATPSKRARC
jgi:hypothetical protein